MSAPFNILKPARFTARTVASLAALFALSACEFVDLGAEFVALNQSEPMAEDVRSMAVAIDFDVGSMEVGEAPADVLYAVEMEYDPARYEPSVTFDPDAAPPSLEIAVEATGAGISGARGNSLSVTLNSGVLLDMAVSTGVGETHLDLTELQMTGLRFQGGVGRAEILFGQPQEAILEQVDVSVGVGDLTLRSLGNARVRTMSLEGGVGRTEVDFSGEWTENASVDISVGVGQINLNIPENLSVEIQSDESFLSRLDAPSFERRGSRYIRNIVESETPRLIIRIRSGIGGVSVDLI